MSSRARCRVHARFLSSIALLCTSGLRCGHGQEVAIGGSDDAHGPTLGPDGGSSYGASTTTDDGCTNSTDPACRCEPGASRACGSNVGECKQGAQTCQGGHWSACAGAVLPHDEICDGKDNNCDGRVDENCGDGGTISNTHGIALNADAGHATTHEADAAEDTHSVTSVSGDAGDERVGTTSGDAGDERVGTTSGDASDDRVVTITNDCSLAAPRLMAPLSTARVTLQAPTLHWELAAGTDGARIELCTSRDCSNVVETFDAAGASGKVPSTLPAGVHYWRAYGRSGDSTGCTPSPVWEFFSNTRDATLGIDTSWGTVLDVNEDGYADLVVASQNNVFVYEGGPTGLATTPAVTLSAGFSSVVSDAGDLNGDGFGDVLVANWNETDVYFGSASGLPSTPSITLTGAQSGPGSGYGSTTVAAAGDVNGDGYGDLVVGRSSDDQVLVFQGGPNGPSTTPATTISSGGSFFGGSVASAGDVNGDGFGDIIVGAVWSNVGTGGAAFIFTGSASGMSTTPLAALTASAGFDYGVQVAGAGDVNGDGYADVVVEEADARYDNATTSHIPGFWIYNGGPSGTVATAAGYVEPTDEPGKNDTRMTALDANGDGFWDLAIGAYDIDKAYVFSGSSSGIATTPYATLTNGQDYGRFGWWLTGADFDGDGYEDLAVAAPDAPTPPPPYTTWGPGHVLAFPGSAAGTVTTPSITLSGATNAGGFGTTVALSASGS